VIVLDRDLPGVLGDEVCRALVAGGSQSRMLMLTAAGSIEDRVDRPEALLGDTSEGLKERGMAFRRMMLSHIVTGRFEHPNSTTSAVRQDPVRSRPWRGCAGGEHEDGPGRRMGCPDTLNQYLTLSRQHRLSRRGRLLRLLDQHPDRPQLIAWLRDHLDKINTEADAAAVGAPKDRSGGQRRDLASSRRPSRRLRERSP